MSSQQTRTPLDRSPAGAEPETHWSEDTDFQWHAATELLIAMGVPRSTARLTGNLRNLRRAPGGGRRAPTPRRQAPAGS